MPLRLPSLALPCGVLIAAALLSCARTKEPQTRPPRSGTSEIEFVPFPQQEGVQGRPGRMVIPAQPKRLPSPRYPESALPDEVACTAQLLYHIETDGTTSLVRLEWPEPPPADHRVAFETAIREAMHDWEYTPALKLVPHKMPDGSTKLEQQAVPKARRVLVHFRVVDGEGVVD